MFNPRTRRRRQRTYRRPGSLSVKERNDDWKNIPTRREARDTAISHYVFEAPVRLWHWLTVGCMLVLMVTGYFIGRPLPSVSGEATYLFYMGDIRLVHFSAAMVFTVILLMRIYWAFVGNRYSRELFIVPVWRRSWWRGAFSVVRWYLFLEKTGR